MRVPWTARRPNQSILKEINPEFRRTKIRRTDTETKAPILWMQRADTLEKTPILGRIEGGRRTR